MLKLDPATYRTVPWKNGGGTTVEALTLPPEASLEGFELRLSMADVAADGPFSAFDGVDRTLVVTDGAGLTLETVDGARTTLRPGSAPFAFRGEDPTLATLVAGPVKDLNVMTRRTALRHTAARTTLESARPLEVLGELALIVALEGEAHLTCGENALWLLRGDIAVLARDEAVSAETAPNSVASATLLVVDVFRA